MEIIRMPRQRDRTGMIVDWILWLLSIAISFSILVFAGAAIVWLLSLLELIFDVNWSRKDDDASSNERTE